MKLEAPSCILALQNLGMRRRSICHAVLPHCATSPLRTGAVVDVAHTLRRAMQERPDWETARKVLADAFFLKRLMEFDRDSVSPRAMKLLAPIVNNPAFTPEQVGSHSQAAMSMCLWVKAMHTYGWVRSQVCFACGTRTKRHPSCSRYC